ncbi:hypothetical protein BV25DRAFT_1971221 [Artomyces pyxidatus]|uniref:Uncharacterized protein n=1 Tax=Artomyces pyxidatus TaxID=48021 RepID=A0ACB8TC77_9AGAM|nr:hypothetical protein BV25DRAFT_1971221 [Artomyces pyxidatus]
MPNTQSPRPVLPTSSTDFALPASSSTTHSPTALQITDDFNPLLFRFRRPSLLAPRFLSEPRLTSPLNASFTTSPLRPSSASESDRERMWADSSTSGSSENATPPLQGSQNDKDAGTDSDTNMKTSRPQTPPRNPSSSNMDPFIDRRTYARIAQPKLPRILNLVTESRPDENEVKSEAQFQRLVASFSELPMQPRTPRAPSDRGRYPEEAGEDFAREDTPSDDDGDDDELATFAFTPPTSEPIPISKPRTPAASVSGSVNGDDLAIDSPGGFIAMDVDMPSSAYGSPSVSSAAQLHQWRYTPPPTASAVRTNKRKYDDRFDPYQTASKRRAVSPSVSYLRESHSSLSPIYIPRGRAPVPVPVASSRDGSVTSSPTVSHNSSSMSFSRQNFGPGSVASSPTLRASMSLASPIARPLRLNGRKGSDADEKEIDGAGDAVGGLTLGQ